MSEKSPSINGTDSETVATYNKAAQDYAEKYNAFGARLEDIDRAFAYCDKENPLVVEIGPGNGREATEILKHTNRYTGVEVSDSMVKLARESLPNADFVLSDIMNFSFPDDVNIIFAFASLLHLDKQQLKSVMHNAIKALADEGIMYISLKRRGTYQSEIQTDEYGSRIFYFYSKDDLLEMLPNNCQEIYYDEQRHGVDEWFTLVLRKQN